MSNQILQFRGKTNEGQFITPSVLAKVNQLNSFTRPQLVNLILVLVASLLFTGLCYFTFRNVISPLINLVNLFIGAWLIALILEPVVRRLVRWGCPKIIAVIITYLVMLLALAGLFALVITELYNFVNAKLNHSSGAVKANINNLAKRVGVTNFDCGTLESEATKMINTATSQPVNLLIGLGFGVVQLILLVIISFTLLVGKEYTATKTRKPYNLSLLALLPASTKRYFRFVYRTIEDSFKGYLLGRVEVALLYGCTVWVVMVVTGINCPIATACLCFLILIIPVVGAPISLFLPSVIGLLGDNKPVLVVLVVLFVIQTLLLNAVLPKFLKKSSESGAVTTLFILLAGAQLGGLCGIMVAVPLAGAVKKILVVTFRLHNQTKKECVQ